jgi:small-conductance mechanosensitive channel
MELPAFYAMLSAIQDWLAAFPDALRVIIFVLIAIVAALVAHGVVVRLLRRAIPERWIVARSIFRQTEGPSRLAFVLFALNLAVGISPLEPTLGAALSSLLQLAFIALMGWIALTSLNIAAELYLLRYDLAATDNLLARKHVTQVRVLKGALATMIVLISIASALMTFESVRQVGVGLFASAGIAGIVAGLAARPLLSNLLAGVQLALTQPIRVDDVVVVENEWGRVEDITMTYVVVRIWDLRRLIVPISYFIEKPFENWTRETAAILGTVLLYVDYTVPVDRVREKLKAIVRESKNWDGNVATLQVTDARELTLELRVLVSARDSSASWDLRCEVREKLIAFLANSFPGALPQRRQQTLAALERSGNGRDLARSRGG